MITHTLSVPNMKKDDEQRVSEALHDVWGVRNVKINGQAKEVVISYDETAGSLKDFEQAIKDIGYQVKEERN